MNDNPIYSAIRKIYDTIGAFTAQKSVASVKAYVENNYFNSSEDKEIDNNLDEFDFEQKYEIEPDENGFVINKYGILLKYAGDDKDIVVPDNVKAIGDNAFEDCIALTSVTIGNGVTSIGKRAFEFCENLKSITIPDNVTSIGEDAFYDCTSLTSITIPDNVTSIGDGAFYNSSSLTNITIPNSVTSIGDYAFGNCTSLTNIKIDDSVTSIGDSAFYYCTSLTSIAIPDSVTSLGHCAFRGCNSLTNATIGDGVTSIGLYTFLGCNSLKSIIFEGNPEFSRTAFTGCNSLEEIIVRNEEIKQYLIENVDLPEGCEIKVVEKELEQSQDKDEYEQEYDEEEIDYKKEYEYLPDENGFIIDENGVLLKYVGNEKDVVVPDGVTSIRVCAFYGRESLTGIKIPDSVTNIDTCAFYGCESLTRVTIGENVTRIGGEAFNGCKSLNSIIFEGSPSFSWNTFVGCSSLKEMVVHNEKMKQYLLINGRVPIGCEIKVVSKELEQSQKDDELTPLEEITLAPDIESLRKECDEIMASDEKFVYDEVSDDKLVTSK